MAHTTPIVTQRVEELEDVVESMEDKITEMGSMAVGKAMGVIKKLNGGVLTTESDREC